jgi:site-specific DNA-methyltransferase (adenine-specific)
MMKSRAPKNRTLTLTEADRRRLEGKLITTDRLGDEMDAPNGTIMGDYREVIPYLPHSFVDLLILDPPYNLDKSFNGRKFSRQPVDDYTQKLRQIFFCLKLTLRKTASIYICGDWHSSASIYSAASEFFIVRNRITWEREKGRGSSTNWKNSCEDIWFCTVSDDYTFNVDQVKMRRKVMAPYRKDGKPKDWKETPEGNFRDTAPSNLWTDITIPFWSMPENTDHPTQKSEKLIAKLILASSNPGDFVFDPFLGSGTTSVVAKKLGRRYLGIEIDEEFCLHAERRLELVDEDKSIQGYTDGVFWERNTLAQQNKSK